MRRQGRSYPIPLAASRQCNLCKSRASKVEGDSLVCQCRSRKVIQPPSGRHHRSNVAVMAPMPVLQSTESRIAAQLITSIGWLGFQHYWLARTPSQIGYHRIVDSAAVMLVLGQQCAARGVATSMEVESIRRMHAKTLLLLQDNVLDANTQLLAKSLVGVFDATMSLYVNEWESHQSWDQLSNLLSS